MFNLNFNPALIISRVITLVIALTLHEFAHAWAADRFGDRTPRLNGRLTLNPLAHLDPIGSLMLVIVGFGWAKPTPVNPYVLRQHSRSALMWVSLAGPLSNFLLAVLGAFPFRMNLLSISDIYASFAAQRTAILPSPAGFLYDFIIINLVLGLFNLIPLPPLDGDKIAGFFLPDSWNNALAGIRPYGPLVLIVLFVVGPSLGVDVLGWIINKPLGVLVNFLIG